MSGDPVDPDKVVAKAEFPHDLGEVTAQGHDPRDVGDLGRHPVRIGVGRGKAGCGDRRSRWHRLASACPAHRNQERDGAGTDSHGGTVSGVPLDAKSARRSRS